MDEVKQGFVVLVSLKVSCWHPKNMFYSRRCVFSKCQEREGVWVSGRAQFRATWC